jgi:Mce-associated membrane protein
MTFPPQPPRDLPADPGTPEPEVGPSTPEAPARTRFATPPVKPPVTPPVPPAATPPATPAAPAEPAAAGSPLDVPAEAAHPAAPAAAEPEPATPAAPAAPAEPAAPAAPVGVEPEPEVQATPPAVAVEAPPLEPAPTSRGKGLVAVLAAVVVVLAALTGFLAWRVHDTQGEGPVAASRTRALDAARASARLVFSYDYRHLASDFKAGRAVTTGQFQGEYDKTTAKLVSDVAPRYKAVVVADVSDAAVVSATEDQVVTLVFLNQQSASSLVATPKLTQSRLEMTMVRKDGRWLVSKIKAL